MRKDDFYMQSGKSFLKKRCGFYCFMLPLMRSKRIAAVIEYGSKRFLFFSILFFLNISIPVFAQTLEAYWTLVFAGKNITQPVFNNGFIYTAGEDKAINCITTKGKFLWRRNTQGGAGKFISVSQNGIVYLVTEKGSIEVYSSQGLPLWTLENKESPLFPVYNTKDGRIFAVFRSKIICLTHTGKIKWTMPLPSPPKSAVAESGAGSFLILLQDKTFLRFSLFGSVLEQNSLKKEIACTAYIPGGYILSAEDGTIYRYAIDKGSKLVSQTKETSVCRASVYKDGKLLYIFENGKIALKDLESGKLLWETKTDFSFGKEIYCTYIRNEFNIVSKGFACVITDGGNIKWSRSVVEKDFMPIITENGLLVGVTKDILNAYRMETKFLRKSERKTPSHSYSITKGKGFDSMSLLYSGYGSSKELLDGIKFDIDNGSVGSKEPFYAEVLAGILQNRNANEYFPQNFSYFERGTAAELLGKMGSFEYRDILLSEIKRNMDSYFAGGILRGFEALAYDPEGKTVEAVNLIMSSAASDDTEVMKAACDALSALALFGSAETAEKAIESIFSVINGRYSAIIKNYARQKIKNIVQ